MQSSEAKKGPGLELIDRLKAARDTARLHIHLLSLDARQRLDELETMLSELQLELSRTATHVGEGVPQKAREIGQSIAKVLREVDDSVELASPVGLLMKRSPATCAQGDSLNEAARIMWDHDCGCVPVVDAEERLVGILTDRDITMASYTRGQPLWSMSVISTMAAPAVSASPSDSIGSVLRLMADKRLRRIPIVENQRLVGIVALADVARHIRHNAGYSVPACFALAHALGDISEESQQGRCAAE